jgi:hypothetical protein
MRVSGRAFATPMAITKNVVLTYTTGWFRKMEAKFRSYNQAYVY